MRPKVSNQYGGNEQNFISKATTKTTALSHVVSEILNVEIYRDLEILVKSQSRLLKAVPFDTMDMVFSISISIL